MVRGFTPKLQAPMIVVHGKHYYMYKLAQLFDLLFSVPCFFYVECGVMKAEVLLMITAKKMGSKERVLKLITFPVFNSTTFLSPTVSKLYAPYPDINTREGHKLLDFCGNCCGVRTLVLKSLSNQFGHISHLVCLVDRRTSHKQFNLPNAWRMKAAGRIVRHLPLVFYSDEASRNISKKWNKHMSFYFTLAGLPPKFSNQDFNTHFLATSNLGSALERRLMSWLMIWSECDLILYIHM